MALFISMVSSISKQLLLDNRTQLALTGSKSTMKTTEGSVKPILCSQERQESDAIDVVLVSFLLTVNIFHTLFWRFHFYFKQVNVGCENTEIQGSFGPSWVQIIFYSHLESFTNE